MPLPPHPKETQRHLALTQLQKSREKSCLLIRASAPQFCRGRAGALTSRRDRSKCQGRGLRCPSSLLGFHSGRRSDTRHRHFSLSAFPTASPFGSGPARCCSMRSSLANHSAPDRRRPAPIGRSGRLCLAPFRFPSAPRRCGARRRKPPFRGKTPETRAGVTLAF